GAKDEACPGLPATPVRLSDLSQVPLTVFRTATFEGANPVECDNDFRAHALFVMIGSDPLTYRITAPDPWLITEGPGEDNVCESTRSSCLVRSRGGIFYVSSDDPSTSEGNVVLEVVEENATCPE